MQNIVYFDNAATSWPKPRSVIEVVKDFLETSCANPGRSGHRMSVKAARVIFEARENLAKLFNIPDPLRVIFTKNATEALNLVFFGLLREGDHVITTSMEHNSVIRPLRFLQEKMEVEIDIVKCSERGELDPDDVKKFIRKNTKLIVMTHGSNVTGTVMPVSQVGKIAKEHGIFFCVDAAQTAGSIPVDVESMSIDLLVFTGHKSLYGLQGTGGLYVGEGVERFLLPLTMGGTGSRSEIEYQPDFLPDKYESGTLNAVGIAGLLEGVKFVLSEGVEKIEEKEKKLARRLVEGLKQIKGVEVYGPEEPGLPVVSLNVKGLNPSEVSFELDEVYGVMSRPGLHCAPLAHKTIGTFPMGTVRLSLGYLNREEEVDYTIECLEKIAMSRGVSYARSS